MQQAQKARQNEIHHREDGLFARNVFAEDVRLRCFDEPIAIIAPKEIVEALSHLVEFVFAVTILDCNQQFIEPRQDFDRVNRQRLLVDLRRGLARSVHLAEARGIPQLRREVAALLDLLFIERNILTAGRDAHEPETQTIRAEFRNEVERVRRVA